MSTGVKSVNLTTKSDDKSQVPHYLKLKSELINLGLSEKQAQVYLLLVEHAELRVQEIAQLANIPRSSVYEILKALFEFGIAEEIIEENHKKIRPYSVGAMRHGLDEKVLELQRLIKDIDELEHAIPITPPSIESDKTQVRYYKDRSGARQIYWNTLRAKSSVYVYSDWGRGRYVGMRFYERFVEESRQRGFSEKVIINISPAALESIKQYSYPDSPISRTVLKDIRVLTKKQVAIKGDTLIYDNTYACVYLKNVEINGFEIESQQFTETQRSIFETLWQTAEPIRKYL